MGKTKKTVVVDKRTKSSLKESEKALLELFPEHARKQAQKVIKDLDAVFKHDRIAADAARDVFLYGYSYALQARAKHAASTVDKARALINRIEDDLEEQDANDVAMDRALVRGLSSVLGNLIRAITINDGVDYNVDHDTQPDEDTEPDEEDLMDAYVSSDTNTEAKRRMAKMEGAGKELAISRLQAQVAALEAESAVKSVVLDKFIDKLMTAAIYK